MAYGDGGFYFLQPVSQPAGAYGGIGSYGELSRGRAFEVGNTRYRLKYQSKAPRTLAEHEEEVADLLGILAKLKAHRARLRLSIKRWRKQITWNARVLRPFASVVLMRKIRDAQDALKALKEPIKLATKNYKRAKDRLEARRPRGVQMPLRVLDREKLEQLRKFAAAQAEAEAEIDQLDLEEAEVDAEPQPEDEPMSDEIAVEKSEEVIEDVGMMAPSLFEEHKNLIYLGGAAAAAFALYKMMK